MFAVNGRSWASGLRDLARDLDTRARAELRVAADTAKTSAARMAPGKIGRTLFARPVGPYEVSFGSTWRKTGLLEFGTKAHEIAPRNGRTLAFQVNGSTVFARVVHHPGNRAYRFMQTGRDAGERKLEVFASGSLL